MNDAIRAIYGLSERQQLTNCAERLTSACIIQNEKNESIIYRELCSLPTQPKTFK